MPVRSTPGIDASLPGGALRLDVNPSEESDAIITQRGLTSVNVVPPINSLYALPQYGSEAVMWATNGLGLGSVQGVVNFASIQFNRIELDYSSLTDQPQCNPTDGTITAWHEGFWEVGCSIVMTVPGAAATHVEVGIWIDYPGGATLPLEPSPNPFGTSNPSGNAWTRIAQRTAGWTAAQGLALPTIPDAAGHPITCSTIWCTHSIDTVASSNGPRYFAPSPVPTRFRFAVRSDQGSALASFLGGQSLCRAWMRWVGATGFSGS